MVRDAMHKMPAIINEYWQLEESSDGQRTMTVPFWQ